MSGAIQAASRRLTAEQRRRQLFTVALELFAQRGYRSTTMDDIAEAAGVTKPLLYQHFSSKRALYLELVDSIAQELLAHNHRVAAAHFNLADLPGRLSRVLGRMEGLATTR